MTDIVTRVNPELCRQCGGRCCQGTPGLWAEPERFWQSFFSGHPPAPKELNRQFHRRGLTLRAVLGTAVPTPRRTEDGCMFLGRNGCFLPYEARPCQCLALEPSLDTLLTDEIDCRLPAPFHSNRVAERWRRWWQNHTELPADWTKAP